MDQPSLLVGADVGGTSTKVAAVDHLGALLGYAVEPGGNIRSSGGSLTENLSRALTLAVPPERRTDVVGGVLGIAGGGLARATEVSQIARLAWLRAGLPSRIEPVVCTDLEIAFADGSDRPDGLMLLAGTGAVACWFANWRVVDRCDGMGWLLGDEGSGVWIGTAALRAVAAHLDGRGPTTALTDLVLGELRQDPHRPNTGPDVNPEDPRQELIRLVDDHPPSWFGRFAPPTAAAAAGGDNVASRIVSEAAEALVRSATRAASGREVADVILAGAVLTTAGPVSEAVRLGLAERYAATCTVVHSPVVGAIILAGRAAGWAVSRQAVTATLRGAMLSTPRRPS